MSSQSSQVALPDLRILPLQNLVLHEEHDGQRSEPLENRLRSEGILNNPPIVAPIPDDPRYVVLDGANRVTALRAMSIPHVVAQVVGYEQEGLVLDTWYHLVGGLARADFMTGLSGLPGVSIASEELIDARAGLLRRDAIAYVVYAEGSVHTLRCGGDLHERTACLNRVVNIYKNRGSIFRANTDQVERLLPYHGSVTALVVFPRYRPAEILELARCGVCVPAGITRHLIPGRALRLNFPLSILADERSMSQKNEYLTGWLRSKMAGRQARYYEESTYLFDE